MKRHFPLFGIVGILVLLALLPRLWTLHLLYTDSAVRAQTRSAMELVAAEEGVLLSGLDIYSLTRNQLVLHYRAHMRGQDAERCFAVEFAPFSYVPCDASS